jgi:hypothetical protein
LSDTKECITDTNCGSDYKLCIDFDNSVFICLKQISGTTQCPSSFPYEYSNLCLKKCSDTQKTLYTSFNSIPTYSHITSTNKKCVTACNDNENANINRYYDEDTFTCIYDCSKTSKKYIDGNKCVQYCENKYHNYGEYKCNSNCDVSTDFKFKSETDKICYKDCTKLSPLFYYDKEKTECFVNCNKYILKKMKMVKIFFIA